MYCSKCGAIIRAGDYFCSKCGSKIQTGNNFCPKCEAKIQAGDNFCPKCGNKINALVSSSTLREYRKEYIIKIAEYQKSLFQRIAKWISSIKEICQKIKIQQNEQALSKFLKGVGSAMFFSSVIYVAASVLSYGTGSPITIPPIVVNGRPMPPIKVNNPPDLLSPNPFRLDLIIMSILGLGGIGLWSFAFIVLDDDSNET